MFGHSEDRARQLAGRHRKDRNTSSGSYASSSRNVSSSTQSSNQLQPTDSLTYGDAISYVKHPQYPNQMASPGTSTQIQHTGRPSSTPFAGQQQPFQQAYFNASPYQLAQPYIAYAPPETPEQLAARRAQLEQERYQSEYLTKVLYGNPTVPNFNSPPSSQFMQPYVPAPLSYLPSRRALSHQFDRTGFSQTQQRDVVQPQTSTSPEIFNKPTKRPKTKSLLPQTTSTPVSPPSNDQDPQLLTWKRAVPSTTYFEWNDWVRKTKDYPLWHEPITPHNNPGFGAFLNNLPKTGQLRFHTVFHGNEWGQLSDSGTARQKREWFQCLSRARQQTFKLIVQQKKDAIEAAGPDAAVNHDRPNSPGVMLFEALEAIETRYDSYTLHEHSSGFQTRYPVIKSNSAPNFGARQFTHPQRMAGDGATDPDPFTTYWIFCVFHLLLSPCFLPFLLIFSTC